MSADKVLRLDGKPRAENGIRIIAEFPGAIPDSIAEQLFADIYGVTNAEVEENGRRMVASWNACQSIPTSDLEAGVVVPVEVADALRSLVHSVEGLIASSDGVGGLHRNGDFAPWSELTEGGQFESWLLALSEAKHVLSRLQQNGGEPK